MIQTTRPLTPTPWFWFSTVYQEVFIIFFNSMIIHLDSVIKGHSSARLVTMSISFLSSMPFTHPSPSSVNVDTNETGDTPQHENLIQSVELGGRRSLHTCEPTILCLKKLLHVYHDYLSLLLVLVAAVMVTRQDKSCVISAISVLRKTFPSIFLRNVVSVNWSKIDFCSNTNSKRTLRHFQRSRYWQLRLLSQFNNNIVVILVH